MKIAGVQMDVRLNEPEANLDRMVEFLGQTTRAGARLTIYPECCVSGYCCDSLTEGESLAEPVPGPATQRMIDACREHDCFAVFGMIEADGARLFNAAVLTGPEGIIGSYRKVHLPYLGIDMHTTPGDRPFAVQSVEGVQVGMNICYDVGFPEAARCLSLLGADLIVLPTNWPPGAECMASMCIAARAMENAVYYAAVNRVGTERGFRFIGQSSIAAPDGTILASADGTAEEILYADIDPTLSRRKHLIRVPGKHEINRLADRRPEMYGKLVEPHDLLTPRDVHVK